MQMDSRPPCSGVWEDRTAGSRDFKNKAMDYLAAAIPHLTDAQLVAGIEGGVTNPVVQR